MGLRSLEKSVTFLAVAVVFVSLTGCQTLGPNNAAATLPPPVSMLSNADIIQMSAAGVSEEVILRTVASQPADFDVRPPALIDLTAQGVSDRVVQSMQARMTQRPPVAIVEPASPVFVEPSIHFGVPFFYGHRHHRHHHRPHFNLEFWHGW